LTNRHPVRSTRNYFRGTFSSLKIRNYRLYFTGQGISLCGTWMQIVGQAWLVLQITNSGTALGLVVALQYLPILILAPGGGIVADRFNKRRVLYATQAGAGILALILGILVVTNVVRLWMILVLAALLGIINAVDNPTRQVFIHELVGGEELRNGVTLNSIEVNLTRVIGPAVAGALIVTVGIAQCFFINAASYVAVLACLLLMRKEELRSVEPVPRASGQLRAGFRYVSGTPVLRDTLIMMGIIGTLTFEFGVSLPLVAKFTFHAGARGLSLLTAFMGAGAVLGGLATSASRRTAPRGLVSVALAFGGAMILATLAPSLTLCVAAMVLVGVFSVIFISLGNTILQLESVPNMRGRVMALWSIAFLGSTTIGGPIIGWVGNNASPSWALAVGGAAALAAGVYGLVAMRNYPSQKAPAEVVLEKPIAAEEDARVL
jgi:MFS family permease